MFQYRNCAHYTPYGSFFSFVGSLSLNRYHFDGLEESANILAATKCVSTVFCHFKGTSLERDGWSIVSFRIETQSLTDFIIFLHCLNIQLLEFCGFLE